MTQLKYFFLSALVITLLVSCSHHTVEDKYFTNTKGCSLLYNLKTESFEKIINEAHCQERLTAFSTFKVPLAVMAFDSGVLQDENIMLKWNGVKSSREVSNQDHNAKSWMQNSIVWFSQRLTPKLGKKRFQRYLADFNYGNQDISEGITTAWLTSPAKDAGLRISPFEQVEFMKKLWTNKLPVSPRSMELTQKITYLETTPKGFRFSGKTGSNFYDKEQKFHAGWFISHLQKDDQEFIAVTNLSDLKPFEGGGYGGTRAKAITIAILKEKGLW